MIRFMIRDLLWLMVAVGALCGWLSSAIGKNRLKQESQVRWVAVHEVAVRWAKEKGETIEFNIGTAEYGAEPNGTITVYSVGE